MAQTVVNNVTLQLRQDTITNWESNQTKLKKGEPGLIYNDGGSSLLALVIGQNDSTEAITLYQEKLCFYPGKGAGYELPRASESVLGGIKIDTEYFDMNGDTMQPNYLFYTIGYEKQQNINNNLLITQPNTDLAITGDLYFNNAYGEYLYVQNYHQEDYSSLNVANTHISIHTSSDDTLDVDTLTDTETAGLLFYNYKGSEQELPESQRSVAEFGVNNKGILVYTPTKDMNRQHVLTMNPLIAGQVDHGYLFVTRGEDGSTQIEPVNYIQPDNIAEMNTLTININGDSFQYSPNLKDAHLVNEVNFTIPTTYCDTVVFNGVQYPVDGSHTITISDVSFTEEDKDLLSKSINSITYLGKTYTTTDHSVSLIDNRTSEGSDLIDVSTIADTTTISHKIPQNIVSDEEIDGSNPRDLLENNLTYIASVVRDEYGHFKNYFRETIDTTSLKTRLETIETKIEQILRRLEQLEAYH